MKLHQKLFWLLIFLLPVQLGRHFWPEWSYVFGLQIDYLSPTIYLTDLLVVGILASWWWEIKKNYPLSTIRYSFQKYWWVFVIFTYLLINSLLAQNPGAALYKFLKIFEFTLLGLYVAKNNYPLSVICQPASLAVIYSSLIAIAQFLKQASLNGVFWWLGERTFTSATPGIAKAVVGGRLLMRPYATFPHPNTLAGFLFVFLILLSNWKPETRNWKFSKWLAVAFGMVAIVISFSRSVWIVGILIGLWFGIRKIIGGKTKILSLGFLLPFSTGEAVSQRVQLGQTAISMIKKFPLAGVGLNNFIVRLPEFWQIQSIYWLQPVHNIFLLVAAETGLVGLAIFLWFLVLTFKKLPKKPQTIRYPLSAILPVILLLGLTDHYWLTLQQTQLLFAIVLGLAWGYNKKKSTRRIKI